jgi:hypothetical protein
VLGHSTMKQVQTYRPQASQLLLARGAQNLRDAMYRQQLHDEQVALAGNITKLRASNRKGTHANMIVKPIQSFTRF